MDSELLRLAERVEAATGADRVIDAEITDATQTFDPKARFCIPSFTASLDAAMMLVPEGRWVATLGQCDDVISEWYARIEAHDDVYEDATGPTAALALTAAVLRSRAHEAKEER